MPYSYESDLAELAARGRRRELAPRAGIDFTSNDYLALAESPELRQAAHDALARGVPAGAGGSRLLRGNHPEHEALEADAAAFFGTEAALYFGGGFTANYAIFATLPQRGDLVVHDALIHASVHQGVRSGRADHAAAAHNDADAFDDAIRRWRARGGTGRPWIAVESLYSMDGDRAPLADLARIADRHDGILVIDEAHATGVYGPDGRGLGAGLEGRPNVVSLHTCGKALGVMGGLVCGPRLFRDFLVNRCRPFIYATAPSPLVAALVRAALKLCRDEPARRERLARLVTHAGAELSRTCGIEPSGSQIQPVVVGSDARALAVAAAMQAEGYDIRAIRPPTVPEGTSRLRIALTLNVNEKVVRDMLGVLARKLRNVEA
ncbi:MAG TPA: 8-amino-7-oxononanoate synthase [Hyphomicrobiaceae bacterium]|nr:8-amino-7-oxononanoate synthase [Hyphomicrobiaceae bacterium]